MELSATEAVARITPPQREAYDRREDRTMSGGRDYTADSEFRKLCARLTDIDLTLAALELARDAYPGLDFSTTLEWIDQRADELAGPVARAQTEIDVLQELASAIAGTHGISGDSDAYNIADSSYLPRVIETGRGIPISLSVLYIAVAARVGIELQGVAAPMHYLTRYESSGGPLFVDSFSAGRILDSKQCIDWLQTMTQLPEQQIEASLRPTSPRTTIVRMLNNLKTVHARQENWQEAWKVQHRLVALQPTSQAEQRDLALISLRAQRPGEALDLFKSCLKNCAQDDRKFLQAHLDEAQNRLARWN